MNREIKFKCWIPESRKMLVLESTTENHNHYLQTGSGGFWLYASAHGALMASSEEGDILLQFTGLQDKNGKDIYEGDIITHQRHDKPYSKRKKVAIAICVVEWDMGNHADIGLNPAKLVNPSVFNSRPGFRGRLIDGPDWSYDWSEFHDCEVIGNIYENPELLTPSK